MSGWGSGVCDPLLHSLKGNCPGMGYHYLGVYLVGMEGYWQVSNVQLITQVRLKVGSDS